MLLCLAFFREEIAAGICSVEGMFLIVAAVGSLFGHGLLC